MWLSRWRVDARQKRSRRTGILPIKSMSMFKRLSGAPANNAVYQALIQSWRNRDGTQPPAWRTLIAWFIGQSKRQMVQGGALHR